MNKDLVHDNYLLKFAFAKTLFDLQLIMRDYKNFKKIDLLDLH